jgi:hypothetical protein
LLKVKRRLPTGAREEVIADTETNKSARNAQKNSENQKNGTA